MQEKFDDVASVKDSRAKGDGATDDTAPITPHYYNCLPRNKYTQYVEPCFFPGTYVVTDVIKIPTFAKLVGDGHNSSIIKANSATPLIVLL